MRNCPNCGAPLEPDRVHCAYCGTYYFDLTAFDCTKKCFVKFKTHMGNKECIVTALAIPSLDEAEVSTETTELSDGNSTLARFTIGRTCDLKATFRCVANPETKNLFTIELPEEEA